MVEETETIHKFKQQCFLVTGGSHGLDGANTGRLLTSNTTVAIWDIDADASPQMKEQLGGSHQINKIQDSV